MFALNKWAHDPAAISFHERRYIEWLQMYPDISANFVLAKTVACALDKELLRKAILRVAKRFDALRTAFVVRNGVLSRQIVPSLMVAPLTVRDADEDCVSLQLRCREFASARFEPNAFPLFRVMLSRGSDERSILVLSVSQSISDVASMALAFKALGEEYAGVRDGLERHPSPPFSLSDFVQTQLAWVESAEGRAKRAMLIDRLHTREREGFIYRRGPTPIITPRRACLSYEILEPELVRQASTGAARLKTTPFALYVTLAAMVGASIRRKKAFDASVLISNRHHAGAEQIVGHLAGPVPICFDLNRHETSDALIIEFHREWAYAAHHFGSLPISVVCGDLLGTDPGMLRAAPFNTSLLNHVPLASGRVDFAGVAAEPYGVATDCYMATSRFDMFFIEVGGGGIGVLLRCPEGADATHAAYLRLTHALRSVCEAPQALGSLFDDLCSVGDLTQRSTDGMQDDSCA